MIHCTKCNYGWNPDTATICVQCKSPLDSATQLRRSDTLNEDLLPSDSSRRTTIAEGISSGPPPVPRPSYPSVPPPPPPRWNDSASINSGSGSAGFAPSASGQPGPMQPDSTPFDQSQRRRTVFAGVPPVSGEVSAQPPMSPPPPTPLAGGSRRPQTIAVDPARKIVGVLITYSWQNQGQVFPILEGRNLIGRDPAQCDICIPQDSTLSSVNSFIIYHRNFIIGDKVSMSGTDVDDDPIETEFVPLRNYAKIRTGSTYWTFVCIQPPADDSATGA